MMVPVHFYRPSVGHHPHARTHCTSGNWWKPPAAPVSFTSRLPQNRAATAAVTPVPPVPLGHHYLRDAENARCAIRRSRSNGCRVLVPSRPCRGHLERHLPNYSGSRWRPNISELPDFPLPLPTRSTAGRKRKRQVAPERRAACRSKAPASRQPDLCRIILFDRDHPSPSWRQALDGHEHDGSLEHVGTPVCHTHYPSESRPAGPSKSVLVLSKGN